MNKILNQIIKRNGTTVSFDEEKLEKAIKNALAIEEQGLYNDVLNKISHFFELKLSENLEYIPHVEELQDVVEYVFLTLQMHKTAKNFILYREERKKNKKYAPSQEYRDLVIRNKQYFDHDLRREFVYARTYARWLPQHNRREVYEETVDRSVNYMRRQLGGLLDEPTYNTIRESVLEQKAMFSMRHFQLAGLPIDRTNICAYNCSYLTPNELQRFGEAMNLLMLGVGVGFSVENSIIHDLPKIKYQKRVDPEVIIVEDSREGWVKSFNYILELLYNGQNFVLDTSQIRPVGTPLKTMGGRASGDRPFIDLVNFARNRILANQGSRLKSIDIHDILCKIGQCTEAGSTRRSALISISELDDIHMRLAKAGDWLSTNKQRMWANNSVAYPVFDKPSEAVFMEEWLNLVKSGSGERGIINRYSFRKTLPPRRIKLLGKRINSLGVNPCGEIVLQSNSLCNLSEIVVRFDDTLENLLHKIDVATLIGTYQSTLTYFPDMSPEWEQNCKEERLLGVSITGQWDCPMVRNPEVLRILRDRTIEVNTYYAKQFNINPASAITAIKPSGTLSKVVGASEGMHTHYAPYYINRIQISNTDPMLKLLKDQNVPCYQYDETIWSVEFPVRAPEGAEVFSNTLSAIEQLEYWKMVKINYCEHNPSCTIYVGEGEWLLVAAWVYENWDIVGGLSFFPKEDGDNIYRLAPKERISKEEYEKRVSVLKNIDFSKLTYYEVIDSTDQLATAACSGGTCSLKRN